MQTAYSNNYIVFHILVQFNKLKYQHWFPILIVSIFATLGKCTEALLREYLIRYKNNDEHEQWWKNKCDI